MIAALRLLVIALVTGMALQVAGVAPVTREASARSAADMPAVDDLAATVDTADRPVRRAAGTGAPQAARSVYANPLWGLSLHALSATRERPLFRLSRRPVAPVLPAAQVPPVAAAEPEPENPPLTLIGVVGGTEGGFAVFMDTLTNDMVRLRTGEGHQGWVLQSVSKRQAVLEKNGRTAPVSFPQANGGSK